MRSIPRPYGAWLAVLRIYTGIFWLSHSLQKITDPNFGSPDGNIARLVTNSISSSSGVYKNFLTGTIEPHLVLFATILTYAELLLAVSLILGFGTRFAALAAVCLSALYWCMSGQFATVSGYATDNAAAVVLSLTCLVLPVGMFFGLDGMRNKRRRPPPSRSDDLDTPKVKRPADPGSHEIADIGPEA